MVAEDVGDAEGTSDVEVDPKAENAEDANEVPDAEDTELERAIEKVPDAEDTELERAVEIVPIELVGRMDAVEKVIEDKDVDADSPRELLELLEL